MEAQSEPKNADSTRLTLHRIYTKNGSFESFAVTLNGLQNPVTPTLELQVFANVYPQENNLHHAVLGLKIQAKHQADVLWKIQLEQAGFYTLEGFTKVQEAQILNGFCMNQIYAHAGPVVNQMVMQAGFAPVYLQLMDFNQLYQQQQAQEKATTQPGPTLNGANGTSAPMDLASALKRADEQLSTSTLN